MKINSLASCKVNAKLIIRDARREAKNHRRLLRSELMTLGFLFLG